MSPSTIMRRHTHLQPNCTHLCTAAYAESSMFSGAMRVGRRRGTGARRGGRGAIRAQLVRQVIHDVHGPGSQIVGGTAVRHARNRANQRIFTGWVERLAFVGVVADEPNGKAKKCMEDPMRQRQRPHTDLYTIQALAGVFCGFVQRIKSDRACQPRTLGNPLSRAAGDPK